MTQKELSYVEDAIGHEANIIKILEASLENDLEEEITEFLQSELTKHQSMKEKLMNKLEGKCHE